MPCAHAFLQVRDDVAAALEGLSTEQIWARVGQSAPIGYHAYHLAGATERLLTYARGEQLTDDQLAEVRTGEKTVTGLDGPALIARINVSIDSALAQLSLTSPEALTDARAVGRKLLPATTIGLLFHAAEHATRHAGQIATLRMVVAD
jgi:uncharacterized damage-inducible protein DinB